MARSKRYQEAVKKIDKNKVYPIAEAVKLVKETGATKFDGAIEVHVRLGIDPKKGDQLIRGSIALPHGTGKSLTVAAFVNADKEKEAKDAGAQIVGGEELIAKIKQTSKAEFDIAVATPDMMAKLAGIAKILGPRGLMPSPKNGTIGPNVTQMVSELIKGKINFKNDDTANVHQIIGKISFADTEVVENFRAFIEALLKSKPSSSKGTFIRNISISATMGPGVRVSAE